jgi:hypothetical protein
VTYWHILITDYSCTFITHTTFYANVDSPAGANDDAEGLLPDSSSSEAYASVTAMARSLHRADFPCVSVLEGGFDALPLCLAARGCTITEPLLISHDAALFRKWRGCSDSDDKPATTSAATTASTTAASPTSPDHHSRAASSSSTSTVTTTDGRHSPARDALAAAAAAGVGAYKTALKRAEAMGHSVAAAQLRAKLEQAVRHQASAAAVLDEDDAAINSSLHNSSSSSSVVKQQRSRRRFGSRSPSRSASPPKRAQPRLHSSAHSGEHSANSSSNSAPTEQEAPLSQTTKLLARAGAAAAALGRGLGVSASSDDAVQLQRTESWVESAFLPRKDSSSSNKDSSSGVILDSSFVV